MDTQTIEQAVVTQQTKINSTTTPKRLALFNPDGSPFQIGSGGGSGGAVNSVNGKVGAVVLSSTDVQAVDINDARLFDQRTPSNDSVTNAKVAVGAAISLDKTADSATRLSMLPSERTKLAASQSSAEVTTIANARIAVEAGTSLATLVGGKIPTSQIPAVALTEVYVVASQAAMLALTTQQGDAVIRTDQEKTWLRGPGVTGTMSDWTVLPVPAGGGGTSGVTTVNSQTGDVVLGKIDIGLANVDNTADANKTVASAVKLETARTIGGVSFDGTANIVLTKTSVALNNVDNTADSSKVVASAAKLTTPRNIGGVAFDGTANIALTKTSVALNNVDNTADADKPISTLQNTALEAKLNILDFTSTMINNTGSFLNATGIKYTIYINASTGVWPNSGARNVPAGYTGEVILDSKNWAGAPPPSGMINGDYHDQRTV